MKRYSNKVGGTLNIPCDGHIINPTTHHDEAPLCRLQDNNLFQNIWIVSKRTEVLPKHLESHAHLGFQPRHARDEVSI